MRLWYAALLMVLVVPAGCTTTTYTYRGAFPSIFASITEYENFIRHNPTDPRVGEAREKVLKKASDARWQEVSQHLAMFGDIDGARYDEEHERLVLWGAEAGASPSSALPPLLLDDFVVALAVLRSGDNPGVSIGTVRGRVPTQADLDRARRTGRLPIEYIPPSTFGTHMGSVLFEVDRALKGLAHGEDNLTRRPVTASVSGYLPVTRLLQKGKTWEGGKPRPLGLWWFVPDEPGVAFHGYSMRFVRYTMRVKYRALTNDPAVEVFGKHLSEHFEEFAREVPTFRELVRMHKLVSVARWYVESGFPMERFLNEYRRLAIQTPETTRMIQTLASSEKTPGPRPGSYYIRQSFLVGGVDLSPPNRYIPTASLPLASMPLGQVAPWQPGEMRTVQAAPRPPRFGSFTPGTGPLPPFAAPIFQARPSPTVSGWTIRAEGRNYAVVSIPVQSRTIEPSLR